MAGFRPVASRQGSAAPGPFRPEPQTRLASVRAQPTDRSWNGKRLTALTTLGWSVAGAVSFLALPVVVPALVQAVPSQSGAPSPADGGGITRGMGAVSEARGMRPRFVGRIGPADVISVANAVVGLLAAVVATADPQLAARLVLLAAVGDGLDGVVARHAGGTPVGEYLDSLSDVAAFGVAPAVLVVGLVGRDWELSLTTLTPRLALVLAAAALFLAAVVLRLGLYTAYDTDTHHTLGVPSTLAATLLGAAVLARVTTPLSLLAGTVLLAYLMVGTVTYPDLLAQDALVMGVVHVIAVLAPDAFGRAFPFALLTLALAYLLLAPRFYWRPTGG